MEYFDSVLDLLNHSIHAESFNETLPFEKVKTNKTKKEEVLSEISDRINNKNIIELLSFYKDSNILGKLFIEKQNADQNEWLKDYFYDDFHEITFMSVKTNHAFYINNDLQIIEFNNASNSIVRIFDSNYEFVQFLFKSIHLFDSDKKIIEHGLPEHDLIGINTDYDEPKGIKPLVKDDIHAFLTRYGSSFSDNLFYLSGVGNFIQTDDKWYFSNIKDISVDLNDLQSFFYMVSSIKLHNSPYFDQYDDLEPLYDTLMNHHLHKDDMVAETVSEKQDIHEDELMDLSKKETNNISGKSELDLLIASKKQEREILKHKNQTQQEINDSQSLNEHLEIINKMEEDFMNHFSLEDVEDFIFEKNNINFNDSPDINFDESPDFTNIPVDTDYIEPEDEYIYHSENEILVQNELSNDGGNDKIETTILSQQMKNNPSSLSEIKNIEDFFICSINNQFKLKPNSVITQQNGLYLKSAIYVFSSKKINQSVQFVFNKNHWKLLNSDLSGQGLDTFLNTFLEQFGLNLEQKYIDLFNNFYQANKNQIQDITQKRNEVQKNIETVFGQQKKKLEDVISLEYFVLNYLTADNFYLLDVEDAYTYEGGKTELLIKGKHYRFKDNQWYCKEDKKLGQNGILELLDYIYAEDDELRKQKKSSLKQFILKEIFFNENYLGKNNYLESMANYQIDEDAVKNNFNELLSVRMSETDILSYFNITDFLNICIQSGKPYFADYQKSENGNLFVRLGKSNHKHLEISENENTEKLIEKIVSIYPALNIQDEKERVKSVLLPYVEDAERNRLKIDLNTQEQNLIRQEISKLENKEEQVNIQNLQKDSQSEEITNHHIKLDETDQNNTQVKSKEEEYLQKIGKDNLLRPLKAKLSDYAEGLSIKKILSDYKFNNQLFQSMNIQRGFSSGDLNIEFNGKTVKVVDSFNTQEEKWIDENGQHRQSYIELIKHLHKLINKNIHLEKLNFAISQNVEISLLNNFKLDDIANIYGLSKNNKGVYELNGYKFSFKKDGNSQVFSIWNHQITDYGAIRFMSFILACQKGQFINKKEDLNRYFSESLNTLRDLYLGLSDIEMTLINNQKDNTRDQEKLFNQTIPKPLTGNDNIYKYLFEKRKLNQELTEEFIFGDKSNITSIYEGLFYKNNQAHNVAVFTNTKLCAVRGFGESDYIKQNTPGSNASEYPLIFPKSSNYTYKDEEKLCAKIAFCEAPIDALSLRSIYPSMDTIALCGVNVQQVIKTLQLYSKEVKNDSDVKIYFALDNIDIDENGNPLDSTSRKSYFKILQEMSSYCFNEMYSLLSSDTKEQIGSYLISKIEEDLDKIKTLKPYKDEISKYLNKIEEEYGSSFISFSNKEFTEKLSYELFDIQFIKTGIFDILSPKIEKNGQEIIYKDWNDLLVTVFNDTQVANPTLNSQQIHDKIIRQFNIDENELVKLEPKNSKRQMALI